MQYSYRVHPCTRVVDVAVLSQLSNIIVDKCFVFSKANLTTYLRFRMFAMTNAVLYRHAGIQTSKMGGSTLNGRLPSNVSLLNLTI